MGDRRGTATVGIGVGLKKGATVENIGGEIGAAAKINFKMPLARPDQPTITVTGDIGVRAQIIGIGDGKAQFAIQATVVKDGSFAPSGFEDRSGFYVQSAETGARVGTSSNDITLFSRTDTIPVLGPAGVVLSGGISFNPVEATAALDSLKPAVSELGQDLMKLLGVPGTSGK